MKRLIPFLIAMVLWGCASPAKPVLTAEPPPPSTTLESKFTFTAEIHSIEICQVSRDPFSFGRYAYDLKEVREARGGTLVVGFDAHWAIRTTIKSSDEDSPLFQVGDEIVFVVHSPSQTFLGSADQAKGMCIQLDLFGVAEKDGRIGFHTLQRHFEDRADQRPETNAGKASIPTPAPAPGVAHP